jgi:tRNA-specific 2-thiouridylase
MITGIGLLSGGLDSILAIKVLQDQGIHVTAVSFITPFFGSAKAKKASEILGVELRIVDITDIHLNVVRSPKHGYGNGMNPCIDCHALMFHTAGKLMETENADFLFSGEVLGERPMSQNMRSLMIVSEESGYEDYIVRPLSAKLLPETLPEKQGKVDREQLLRLNGRSRKPQIELAKHYGITEYAQPAGGCLLTDPAYSHRLKEMMENEPDYDKRDIELLSMGRHFRLETGEKIIVGRNQNDNERLLAIKNDDDVVLDIEDYPAPIVMIPKGGSEKAIMMAGSISALYSDSPKDSNVNIVYYYKGESHTLSVQPFPKEEIDKIRI